MNKNVCNKCIVDWIMNFTKSLFRNDFYELKHVYFVMMLPFINKETFEITNHSLLFIKQTINYYVTYKFV